VELVFDEVLIEGKAPRARDRQQTTSLINRSAERETGLERN